MTGPQVKELLGHLAHRGALLRQLHDGIHDRRELAAELDRSRSTVDRGLRALREANYVREQADGYALTTYGEFALDVYRQAEQVSAVGGLVPNLPPELPFAVLRNAEVVEATKPLPYEPVSHLAALVQSADYVRKLVPAIIPRLVDVTMANVRDGTLKADIVVSAKALGALRAEYPDEARTGLVSEECTVWRTSDDPSFGLVIADNRTAVGVYDGTGRLLGTITNDSDAALEWALGVFREYREDSDEITLHEQPRETR